VRLLSSASLLRLSENLPIPLCLIHSLLVNVHVRLESVGDVGIWVTAWVHLLKLLVNNEALQDRVSGHSPYAHEDATGNPRNDQEALGNYKNSRSVRAYD